MKKHVIPRVWWHHSTPSVLSSKQQPRFSHCCLVMPPSEPMQCSRFFGRTYVHEATTMRSINTQITMPYLDPIQHAKT